MVGLFSKDSLPLLLALAQRLLGLFLVGDVDGGAHDFNHLAGLVDNGTADRVNVLGPAVGKNDSEIQICSPPRATIDLLSSQRARSSG